MNYRHEYRRLGWGQRDLRLWFKGVGPFATVRSALSCDPEPWPYEDCLNTAIFVMLANHGGELLAIPRLGVRS